MPRILIILLFLLWMAWSPLSASAGPVRTDLWQRAGLFLAVYAALILGMGLWARWMAGRIGPNIYRSLRRYNSAMAAARFIVPAWFGVGLFLLDWGWVVRGALRPIEDLPVELPGLLLGTMPPMLAWMGLWWSQFPADRALREQSLLAQLENDLPVHAPPPFRSYFATNLRLQILFIIVPILSILLIRDAVSVALHLAGVEVAPDGPLEVVTVLGSAALVFLFAPEILRRVLHTQPLPGSALRDRLEKLCRDNGLKYRDILLWRTHHHVGNAAVMGVIPQLRYVLLSDLLLETMTDRQIEAVFAHELGHIVHRHIAWYVVFVAILMMLLSGPGALVAEQVGRLPLPAWFPPDLALMLLAVAAFVGIFGLLSRRFERQADVFAARTMQRQDPDAAGPPPAPCHVGPYGAKVFASALHRVAVVNNMSIAARSWHHGSIKSRMECLRKLSTDPALTARFDRVMRWVYLSLLLALLVLGSWLMLDS